MDFHSVPGLLFNGSGNERNNRWYRARNRLIGEKRRFGRRWTSPTSSPETHPPCRAWKSACPRPWTISRTSFSTSERLWSIRTASRTYPLKPLPFLPGFMGFGAGFLAMLHLLKRKSPARIVSGRADVCEDGKRYYQRPLRRSSGTIPALGYRLGRWDEFRWGRVTTSSSHSTAPSKRDGPSLHGNSRSPASPAR